MGRLFDEGYDIEECYAIIGLSRGISRLDSDDDELGFDENDETLL